MSMRTGNLGRPSLLLVTVALSSAACFGALSSGKLLSREEVMRSGVRSYTVDRETLTAAAAKSLQLLGYEVVIAETPAGERVLWQQFFTQLDELSQVAPPKPAAPVPGRST